MLQWGLVNLWSSGEEGGYAVQHGWEAQNEFPSTEINNNLWEKTYPFLFPFGVGGLERKRRRPVSLGEHMEWCLDYFDGRFCTHGIFPYHVFSVKQKREALHSARVEIQKKDFDRDAAQLSSITIQRLKSAAEQEANHQPISDPGVRLLRKHLYASAMHVTGSNSSREKLRSEIWGMTILLNAPSLWVTINPDDLHSPIAQIFCGEDIDMDQFSNVLGPGKEKRAVNIAKNPYGTARYFHFIIDLVFRVLFGIHVTSRGRIKATTGIFGVLKGRKLFGSGFELSAMQWLEHD
ncbi:hypothetical protein BKA93DRAFT_818757 [Sparassis latifolia]